MSIQPSEPNLFGQNRFIRTKESLTRIVSLWDDEYESTLDLRGLDLAGSSDLADWWYAYLKGERPIAQASGGQLRVAELFCGPGGLAQGVKQFCREAGYEFLSMAAADADETAVDVYVENHGTDPSRITKDVTGSLVDYEVRGKGEDADWRSPPQITDDRWASLTGEHRVDLLLAGPPCQGHSNLNNHTRRNDDRNVAYLDVPAVAIALDIPIVIIENVPAVIHDHGQVTRIAEALLSKAGYTVETGVLKAAEMGWPQTRSRYFMIARKDRAPAGLHFVSEALSKQDGQPPLTAWWAIADFEDVDPEEHHMYRRAAYTEENQKRISYLHREDVYDLPFKLHNETHRNGTTYPAVYGRLHPDRPAGTITSGFLTPGRGRYVHPTRKRTINPREAARLQGFPDDYRFMVNGEPPLSKDLIKWIGDAVPMPLGYAAAMSALVGGLPRY
jgi:DNA (cytosine-5)-methyltransferase 1